MKIYKRLIIITLALMPIFFTARGQNGQTSPYSRFGYGILDDGASPAQIALGTTGYAMNNGRQINSMNPASYACIDTLTFLFDIGVNAKQVWDKEGDNHGRKFSGGLTNINLQFPLGKYMGGSIGLMPYSQVGYSFGNEIANGQNTYQGSGGINRLYAGVSGRLFKGFTIGANVSYLFGNVINDVYSVATGQSTTLFERAMEIRDYDFRFGAQYSFAPAKDNKVTLGVVFSPGQSFHGRTYGVYYDVTAAENNSSEKPDTIGYTHLTGKYTRPYTLGAGINYQLSTRLMVEADFTYQPWKDVKYSEMEGFEDYHFNNRWKAALGAQFQPNPRGNYAQRIQYRLGAYYNHDYILARGNNVNDFGVTLGFGLPAPVNRWTKTVVNVALEYRRRTSSPVRLLTEDYLQITVGINFNELWFWQNKIQ